MALKGVRRVIKVPCPNYWGVGHLLTRYGHETCKQCKGTGEVDRVIVEFVEVEE